MARMRARWLWWGIGAGVAAWLLWMTLRPNQAVAADLSPLTRPAAALGFSPYLLIDLAGNVFVFVPLGATLVLALAGRPAGRRLGLAVLLGAGFSLSIELVQAALPARVAQPGDWALNTLGTAIGALTGWLAERAIRREVVS
ncbi:MAG TPA: VanZ family protein [Chloroflexi bacterium]|nr:VanZ family protein [Chloroflexota bacterium]